MRNIEYIEGKQNLGGDFICIPSIDLESYGFREKDKNRAVFSALKAIELANLSGVLGISKPKKVIQSNPSPDLLNTTFSLTEIVLVNLYNYTVTPIPLNEQGIGDLQINEIFPNFRVANTATNSLVISVATLVNYGYLKDSGRSFLISLFRYLTLSQELEVRSKEVASGLLSIGIKEPEKAYNFSPNTSMIYPIATTYTLTYQQKINQSNCTIDLNIATGG